MTYTAIDTTSYNKAAIYLPGHGYALRPAKMSHYRSVIDHTTNGHAGSSFHQEAMFIFMSKDISAHYLIGKEGQIVQFLDPVKYIAWHAGSVRAMKYSNPYAIGIEMHNTPAEGHCTTPQLSALDWLVRTLFTRFGTLIVETHRYVAVPAGRKIDPSGFPNDEFYAWTATLSATKYRVTNTRGVFIRSEPQIRTGNVVGTLEYNEVFISDSVADDKSGTVIKGSSKWAHMAKGYVHMSNLVKV